MYSNDLAINVSQLSKCYTIYGKPVDRLKQSIVPKVLGALGMPLKSYYHEFWALQNLTMEVKKGETVGVIGRNGSGKSTLLQLICGTLTPTGGQVETTGRISALLELGSGFNPEFSGRDNVYLNGAILGLHQDEIEARFDAIADFADIGEFIEQPVKFYSSGMLVRLAFAVQAMVDPDILIVDEALAVGDERFQRKCFHRLEELKKNGTSILFVSHTGQQIIELCDRALLIEQGQRLLFDHPLTVVRAYQKLIYANPTDQASLIQEYRHMDQFGRIKQEIPPIVSVQEFAVPNSDVENKLPETDFYESSMLPESTDNYPVQGARVDSVKIYNMDGKEVNNLLLNHLYNFEIRGTFFEDREAVHITFGIRIQSGVGVSAIYYPGYSRYINNVKAGQTFHLIHKLRINLNPNTYFVNAGIFSTIEPICMHRITDAIMFRVLPVSENRVFGYVDLTAGAPEFEIIDY